MNYYLLLQYKRLSRFLKESGLSPYLGILILFTLFIILSHKIFQKIQYAEYIYPIIGLSVINFLGNIKRNKFLKSCFTIANYRKIRVIENFIATIPFALFLLYEQKYALTLGFIIVGIILSFFNKVNRFNFVLPTPFYKHPFEFVVGFRKTYLLFLISYTLAFISILVDNFNLGIFALIITFLTCLNFYTKPEPLFYVWCHSSNSKNYLKTKIKTAFIYSFYLSFPILVPLTLFNFDKTYFVLIFEALGMLYVITSLLAKYAYYPSEFNLIQGFVLAISILFPPVLLIVIPRLYSRARQNLSMILK